MSIIDFLTYGGAVRTQGNQSGSDRQVCDGIASEFVKRLKQYGREMQVPASALTVDGCGYLYVGKDTTAFHFLFANGPAAPLINYQDLSTHGCVELQSIANEISQDVGDVVFSFSIPTNESDQERKQRIAATARAYVDSIITRLNTPDGAQPEQAFSPSEIAVGLKRFGEDHPAPCTTAFIIMQFGNTRSHDRIVSCIKNTLSQHEIEAFRADDKEYMDDLFSNIKTYMHGSTFGVAVFDRITEDDFNPNVSLEVGYMLGMGKDVLLLKDKTLKQLPTDLTGKLYKPFDTDDVENSIPQAITKWLADKGFSEPDDART